MPDLRVEPMKNWVPEYLDVRELSENEIWIEKEGAQDQDLASYLNDSTVRVFESDQLDGLFLEKRVNERVDDPIREPSFAVLMDEVGSTKSKVAPNIYYVREEDGRLYYGQEFLTDYGTMNDQKIDSMDEAEDVLRSAGKVMGTQNWLDITHGDMMRMYTSGELKGLPEPKNLLFSGYPTSTLGIDYETAFFDDEDRRIASHKSGLEEMNSVNSDDEYDAVRRAIQVNIIARHLSDYFDRMTEVPLEGEDGRFNRGVFLSHIDDEDKVRSDLQDNSHSDSYCVDLNNLLEVEKEATGETNTVLAKNLRRMNQAYEEGFDAVHGQGLVGSEYARSLIREAENYSTIGTTIDAQVLEEVPPADVTRLRWEEINDVLTHRIHSGR